MPIIELIQYGTPVILLGLIISNVQLTTMVNDLRDSVKGLKDGVVWNDTCEKCNKAVDGRLERLESK